MIIRAFNVGLSPRGQGRPRTTVINGHAVVFKTKEDKQYEDEIRKGYLYVYSGIPPLEGALKVSVLAFFPIPKATTKKNMELIRSGTLPYIKKPDADNILKSVLDALNGYAYTDDAQIVKVVCRKDYAKEPGGEGLYVTIKTLDDNTDS